MSAPPPALDPAALRALAVLVEKEQLTPAQYPLTANAVMLACNQQSARDPVMRLDEGEVGQALRRLEDLGLVRVVHGARTLRYAHRLGEGLGLTPPLRVAFAVLALRGPQTVAELLANCERLYRFAGPEDLREALERLARRDPPLASRLPRAPGQREERWAPGLGHPRPSPPPAPEAHPARETGKLLERLAALERRVAALERRLAESGTPGSDSRDTLEAS